MPRCRRPAKRAVSRPARANETNPALSVDRKHLGTSTIGPHAARSVPAVAPHDPRCSADACRSAIGRPILISDSHLSGTGRPRPAFFAATTAKRYRSRVSMKANLSRSRSRLSPSGLRAWSNARATICGAWPRIVSLLELDSADIVLATQP